MPHQRFPKVEILSLQPHEIKFILSETDTSMANSLRRVMIGEVPTLAIDLVEFAENSTVLNDEYIAHRLGLVPLRYQPQPEVHLCGSDVQDVFVNHWECQCYEHCPRCSVEFDLDVTYHLPNQGGGDLDHDDDDHDVLAAPLTVTSKDLISNNDAVQPAHFLSPEEQEEAQDEGIALVKLGPGQRLKLKAIARSGMNKEHAKWCPVAVATYRFWPVVHIDEEQMAFLTMEQKQTLVDACSDGILELDEVTGQIRAVEDYWDRATFTEDLRYAQDALKKRPEDPDFVRITQSTDRFIFNVESTGAMDAEEIVMAGLRLLKKRLTYLALELDNLKGM